MLIKFHYKDGAHPDLKGVRAFDLKKNIIQWNNDDDTVSFWSTEPIKAGWTVHLKYVDNIELVHDKYDDDMELCF